MKASKQYIQPVAADRKAAKQSAVKQTNSNIQKRWNILQQVGKMYHDLQSLADQYKVIDESSEDKAVLFNIEQTLYEVDKLGNSIQEARSEAKARKASNLESKSTFIPKGW